MKVEKDDLETPVYDKDDRPSEVTESEVSEEEAETNNEFKNLF